MELEAVTSFRVVRLGLAVEEVLPVLASQPSS